MTSRRGGDAVGGLPQTLGHANFAARSHRTDVQGLFFAGDTVFPGQGAPDVTVYAFDAARSAARRLRPAPVPARGRRSVETQEVVA